MSPRPSRRAAWPFPLDDAAAARHAERTRSVGPAFTERVLALVSARAPDVPGAGDRSLVTAAEVEDLVASFGLASPREAALLALPAAAALARPPISDYHVGAVGLASTGELVLGGNLEFPGASIHHTVHGEGFVALRARALGLDLEALAISQARPCAHCRQVLAELAWADDLRLVDPYGADVALWDVYPAPFTPVDLGQQPAGAAGLRPSVLGAAARRVADPAVPPDVADALAWAGALAHAPYSGEPAAVVVRVDDGRLVPGAVLESVAFNPSIGPLQDAVVGLAAAGIAWEEIRDAWVATVRDPRVGHEGPVRDLLAAVAPGASLHATYWA